MIKLVAADMDGTLLNSQQRLPPRLFPIIRALREKDVRFAVASGRQYYNLLERFEGLEEDILFIGENGGMVFDGRELLYASSIPIEKLQAPVRLARSLPGAYVVLCGTKSAYLEDDDSVFNENARRYYAKLRRVPDVLDAAGQDSICKMAVFQHRQAELGIYPEFLLCGRQFQVVLSGDSWVDLMEPGVNKGSAIRQIQQRFGITPDESMAFGDYLNDCEMMRAVRHSYAMANAHPGLREVSRMEAPSNDEEGVIQVLVREFALTC
ncbi:MAG: Cof-type HAD-IIB family hydrolase [Intestinibacillus sp.]